MSKSLSSGLQMSMNSSKFQVLGGRHNHHPLSELNIRWKIRALYPSQFCRGNLLNFEQLFPNCDIEIFSDKNLKARGIIYAKWLKDFFFIQYRSFN